MPGKLLLKLGTTDANSFDRHMLSNKMITAMRKLEEDRARRPWDGRIKKLFATPSRASSTMSASPFRAPLTALLDGGREEEILQLRPDDFVEIDDKNYYQIRRSPGNTIKSDAAQRLIPVHPELERLSLLRLVEVRRAQGEPRLFPHLKRSRTKETFTEIFSKTFNRYREADKCY